MTGSFAARLARVEARVSWRYVLWRKRSGAEWAAPMGLMLDAWLRSLVGQTIDLEPHLSMFIATSMPPARSAGDIEWALWHECRAIWFPDEYKQKEEQA